MHTSMCHGGATELQESEPMNKTLTLVIYMALLTWITVMAASVIRSRGWTSEGVRVGCGNREKLPEPTLLSGCRAHGTK